MFHIVGGRSILVLVDFTATVKVTGSGF